MSKLKLNIAVSGLNNIDSPGPGVPVIRAIRESDEIDARIIGLAYENLEPGAYMKDIVDKTYKVPYPSEGSDALTTRIKYIHEQEKLDLLIPNFDAELFSFMKSEKLFNELGIQTFLPTIQQFEERQKSRLPEFGKKYNIHVPHSEAITDYRGMSKFVQQNGYPVMIKGRYYDAYVANNEMQAQVYFNKLSAKWGLPVIIQQYITGTEVNVIALGDGEGKTVAAVPMRKQYITDKGKAWGGITLDAPDMLELTNKIISQTKWRGGMELELIRTADNKLYVIEINPRIPAWVYLAVGAGQNIPEALVKLAIGKSVKPLTKYEVGKMFIRYSYDLITDISEFEKLSTRYEL
jgi:carbamoyl-phosphate synthase large subunit